MERNNNCISVAIPTFNSSNYLRSCLKSLINISLIDEIIINDDCSNEIEFNKIKKIIRRINNSKIKIYKNEKNIGAFKNKYECIKKCKNDIVYQLDSDNIATSTLPKVLSIIMNEQNINYLYLPSKIYQFRKYPNFAKFFSIFNRRFRVTFTDKDYVFNKEIIKQAIGNNLKVTVDKNINWVLNSGNFVVNRKKYLKIFKKHVAEDIRHPMDAVAISYFWIENGGDIKTLKDFKHFHRKRTDSVSFVESEGSFESLTNFRKKFLELD
jgi:glycosyltransferase involved in cell wall biosynthesis